MTLKRKHITHAVAVLLLIVPAAMARHDAKRGYKAIEVESGGTIVGVVKFDGETPAPELIDVKTKEDVCHADPIYSEELIVSKQGQVRWAVLSLTDITKGKAFPKLKPDKQPKLDQKGCVYDPHIVVVPKGKSLKILNSDGVLHNVHTWPKKNRAKNIAMPGVIKQTKLRFRRAEKIRVSCDIHPWMKAYIVVTDHPYFAVSDVKGQFKLTDVPPGKYTLAMWHETLKKQVKQTVTVAPGKTTKVEFTLDPTRKESKRNRK